MRGIIGGFSAANPPPLTLALRVSSKAPYPGPKESINGGRFCPSKLVPNTRAAGGLLQQTRAGLASMGVLQLCF